ncbi:ABC transporter substrate-binding protein [Vibrio maritimus]|uniref:ABC transporter substrate-binding protein n=1 Tax=Vibrio maritimus TaxID=990268 RepID=UPI003736DD03
MNNLTRFLAFLSLAIASNGYAALTLEQDTLHPVTLKVHAAAYLSEMQPLIDDFERRNPDILIDYKAVSSNLLTQQIRDPATLPPDVTISSVMDQQIRLVNDGYALRTPYTDKSVLPSWTHWREELYGFSYEPAVIVFNRAFLYGKRTPTNRVELIHFIRRHSNELQAKIGLFDIRKVGMGYLLWSFERAQATNYGQFLELFNSHDALTFNSSAAMLEAVNRGDINMAYNVVGSYAKSFEEDNDGIVVVAATDYTPVIIRSAFVNKTTETPIHAQRFLNYLLSYQGQKVMAEQTNMPPIRLDVESEKTAHVMRNQLADQLKPLPLDVSLLVISDQSKKQIVISEWENALKDYE